MAIRSRTTIATDVKTRRPIYLLILGCLGSSLSIITMALNKLKIITISSIPMIIFINTFILPLADVSIVD